MKAFLAAILCVAALGVASAELSNVRIAEIQAQALSEAAALLGNGTAGRSADTDGSTASAAIARAAARIEFVLLKAAAMEDARNAAGPDGARRLLATPGPYETLLPSEDANSLPQNRRLLAYTVSASRPTAVDARPYCSFRPGVNIQLGAPGSGLADGFLSNVTDAGECCAACLFRKDCFAWTLKSGIGSLNGCYLRGKGYKVGDAPGYVSGVMTKSAEWKRPLAPKPRPLVRGKGKYAEALRLTPLFFAAQQSGVLPAGHPISWRASSHTDDKVPGGWYDASDYMKANFPMSVGVSFMAWALVSFPRAFSAAGATTDTLAQLRVANDYLLACYDEAGKRYVGQIGRPDAADQWGRADEVRESPRTAFTWSGSMKGSDLLSNVAAAWAASSLAFRDSDPTYADTLKAKAKSIYDWAKTAEGKYSDAYRDGVYTAYPSSGFLDSQTWAAGWLFRASGNRAYLDDAAKFWKRSYGTDPFSADIYTGWDSLWAPAAVLMRQIARRGAAVPGKASYDAYFQNVFLPAWIKADGTLGIRRTPKGMSYPEWNVFSNLQMSTTAAMVMLQDAANNKDTRQRSDELAFARRNVDYALGSGGRSFVVGWGNGPPKYWRHAGSSCPARPEICDSQNAHMKSGNPNKLSGALVGGPAGKRRTPNNPDAYVDDRDDVATNEPSVIMNAGLVGALAGVYAFAP